MNKRRFGTLGKILVILFCIGLLQVCLAEEKEHAITSPDGKITVSFQISDRGNAMYDVRYDGAMVLQKSMLGIAREDEDFTSGLMLESASDIESVKSDYEMAYGKKRSFSYEGNKRIFHLKKISGKEITKHKEPIC